MGVIQQDKDTLNGNPFLYEQPFAIGGHVKCCLQNLKGSSSYATGGDTLNASSLGLGPNGKILFIHVSTTYNATYSPKVIYSGRGPNASVKILWIVNATGAEVANAVDMSASLFRVEAIGIQ
jgi:hypothetical protein